MLRWTNQFSKDSIILLKSKLQFFDLFRIKKEINFWFLWWSCTENQRLYVNEYDTVKKRRKKHIQFSTLHNTSCSNRKKKKNLVFLSVKRARLFSNACMVWQWYYFRISLYFYLFLYYYTRRSVIYFLVYSTWIPLGWPI